VHHLSTSSRRRLAGFAPVTLAAALFATAAFTACGSSQPGRPGHVLDEAAKVNRSAESFKAADEDYFRDMDGGVKLEKGEVEGRNTWIVWTGGNDLFWDRIHGLSIGTFDLLKTVSSHRALGYGRRNRFEFLGVVNEPCFTAPTGPDPNRYGLWLDVRDPKCPPDPFANAEKYPGVKIGSRGTTVPVGSYYGEPSGIVGLRLFPNPAFDEKARRKWNAERYYNDPTYYDDRDLVKPYRVGMSCAFCHVGPNPVRPPKDPENPAWSELSSNVGAQFWWADRIFNWRATANKDSFFYQLLRTSRPGSLDTSLVSSDNINNPRTMNAVYMLKPRLELTKRWHKEILSGGSLDNKQFNDYVPAGHPLAQFFEKPNVVYTPRVLKDGSDSVGALGALNRVYLNIGLFSEEWLLHFRPVIGGERITPIKIADAEKNSSYWRATEAQTLNMAAFFLKTDPHLLKDAPGGAGYLTADAATLDRGKVVFGEYCARCHSSKIPDLPAEIDLLNHNNKEYLTYWDRYWAYTKTPEFKAKMRAMVQAPDFLTDNYLSTELRVPSTLLQTNMCSPVATNAIAGNIWDNFSSTSYKELPSVGTVKVRHPTTGAERDFTLPGGGRGFTRPASLVSLWSTAPFLQNNTLGRFDVRPSVEARMEVFDDAITQLLWPEKRRKDKIFGDQTGPGVGWIDRTTQESSLTVAKGFVPRHLRPLLGIGQRLFPMLVSDAGITIGPIPEGFPVGLLSNADLTGADLPEDSPAQRAHKKKVLQLLKAIKREFKARRDIFASPEVAGGLLEISKCPDFVVNKGHYFGTQYQPDEAPLSDSDKNALIALLKTF
jgi:hypothetical protein